MIHPDVNRPSGPRSSTPAGPPSYHLFSSGFEVLEVFQRVLDHLWQRSVFHPQEALGLGDIVIQHVLFPLRRAGIALGKVRDWGRSN